MINNVKSMSEFALELRNLYFSFTKRMDELIGEYYVQTRGENAYDWPDLSKADVEKLNQKLERDKQIVIDELVNGFQNGKYKVFVKSFIDILNKNLEKDALNYPALDYNGDNKLENAVDSLVILSDAHLYKTNLIFDEIDSNDESVIKEILLKRHKEALDEQAEVIMSKEINKDEMEVFWDNIYFINLIDKDNPRVIFFPDFIVRKQ